MQKSQLITKVPVMIISGETSEEAHCFDYGVADFIQKPFNEKIVKTSSVRRPGFNSTLSGIQILPTSCRALASALEDKVRMQTETLREQNQILQKQTEKLKENNIKIIDVLGNVVESRG